MAPTRIQRKRTKGWRMPANTVYVGRPTKWGNPFVCRTRGEAVTQFLWKLTVIAMNDELYPPPGTNTSRLTYTYIRNELHGKNLACWCPLDQPCHADVLLAIANL